MKLKKIQPEKLRIPNNTNNKNKKKFKIPQPLSSLITQVDNYSWKNYHN
jgi:hypothetical protein